MNCNNINNNSSGYWIENWKFNHHKLKNHQGYLKSNDIINLSVNRRDYGIYGFLQSHDVQFTIGNNTFQEVVCHKERLGGNDEVSKLFDLKFFVQIIKMFSFFSGVLNLLNKKSKAKSLNSSTYIIRYLFIYIFQINEIFPFLDE